MLVRCPEIVHYSSLNCRIWHSLCSFSYSWGCFDRINSTVKKQAKRMPDPDSLYFRVKFLISFVTLTWAVFVIKQSRLIEPFKNRTNMFGFQITFTIRSPTFKMSGFRMNQDFECQVFGSPLYAILNISNTFFHLITKKYKSGFLIFQSYGCPEFGS